MIRRLFAALVYRDITQVDACASLKARMGDLSEPMPTRDQHGRPRRGWHISDGREVLPMKPRTRLQLAADRILRKHGRSAA